MTDDFDAASDQGSKGSKAGKWDELDEEMKSVAAALQVENEKGGKKHIVVAKSLKALRVENFATVVTSHELGHALNGVGCYQRVVL